MHSVLPRWKVKRLGRMMGTLSNPEDMTRDGPNGMISYKPRMFVPFQHVVHVPSVSQWHRFQ